MNPLSGALIPRQEQNIDSLSFSSLASPSSFIFLIFSTLALGAFTLYYLRNKLKGRKVTPGSPQRPSVALAPISSVPVVGAPVLSAPASANPISPSTLAASPAPILPMSKALPPHVATLVASIAKSFPSSASPSSPYGVLERFYLNIGKDVEGRMLAQIQNLSLDDMEHNHNHIQWMCPIDQPSQFNFQAPALTVQQYRTLSQNPIIRRNVKLSFLKIMKFLGLQYQSKNRTVQKSASFETQSKVWLSSHFNHNYLRITRILRWLVLFNFNQEAQAFYRFLETLRPRRQIPEDTFKFWEKAAQPIVE